MKTYKFKLAYLTFLSAVTLMGMGGCQVGKVAKDSASKATSSNLKYFNDFSSKFCIVNASDSEIKVINVQTSNKSDWIIDPQQALTNFSIHALDAACVDLTAKGKWSDIVQSSHYPFLVDIQTKSGIVSFQADQLDSTGDINAAIDLEPRRSTTKEYKVFHKAGDDSGFPTNTFIFQEPSEKQQAFLSNWMSSLPNSTKIGQMLIPGTHDSGVNYEDGLDCTLATPSLAAAQGVSIAQENTQSNQLKDGIRYFDIRLENSNGILYPYHKSAGLGCRSKTGFEDTLQNIINFITSHPSETVILRFTHSDSVVGDAVNLLRKMVNNNKKNFYMANNDDGNWKQKTLGEIRGKIVLLMGCEFSNYLNSQEGLFRFAKSTNLAKCNNDDADAMVIYDKYSNSKNFIAMHNDQIEKLRKAANSHDQLVLLSWTLTGGQISAHTPRPATALAHYAKYFGKPSAAKSFIENKLMPSLPVPNIVYYDFENPGINEILIKNHLQINSNG